MLASQFSNLLPRPSYFTPLSTLNSPQSKFRLFKHSKCKSQTPFLNKKFNLSPRNRIILKSFESEEFNERYSGFDQWTVEELELAIQQLGFPTKGRGLHEKDDYINALRRIVHFILEDPFIQPDGTITTQQIDLHSLTYSEARRRLLQVGAAGIQNMRKSDMVQTLQQIYGKRKLAESMVYDQQKYLFNQQFQSPEDAEKELSELLGEEKQFQSDIDYLLSQLRTRQLRDACEYRGLPSHGKKVDLVKKLIEPIVKELDEEKLLPGLSEIENQLLYIAGIGDLQEEQEEVEEVQVQEQEEEEEEISEEKLVEDQAKRETLKEYIAFNFMSYNELRKYLSKRGIKASGKKIELIQRAQNYYTQTLLEDKHSIDTKDQLVQKQIEKEKPDQPEEPEIHKEEKVQAEVEVEQQVHEEEEQEVDLDSMSYNEVRLWLSQRGLKTGGKKLELIERAKEYLVQQKQQQEFQAVAAPEPKDEEEDISLIIENLSDEEIQSKLIELHLQVSESREENMELLKQTLREQSELGEEEIGSEEEIEVGEEEYYGEQEEEDEEVEEIEISEEELKEFLDASDELENQWGFQSPDEAQQEDEEIVQPSEDQLDDLYEKVNRLTVRQIKDQLDQKDLPTTGSRDIIENRLYQALKDELVEQVQEESKLTVEILKDIKDQSIEALNRMKQLDDPPLVIAVICGGITKYEKKNSWTAVQTIIQHLADDLQLEDLWISQYLSSDEMQACSRYGLQFYYYYMDINSRIYHVSDGILSMYEMESIDYAIEGCNVREISVDDFITEIKEHDIVIPTFYGDFGEKGTLLDVLDANHVPNVGPVQSNFKIADRTGLYYEMIEKGFPIPPSLPLERDMVMEWADQRMGIVKFMEYLQKVTSLNETYLQDLENPFLNYNSWPLSLMLRSDPNEDYDEKDAAKALQDQEDFMAQAYMLLQGYEPDPDEFESAKILAFHKRNQPTLVRDLVAKHGKGKPYFKVKTQEDLMKEMVEFERVERILKQVDVPILEIEGLVYRWLNAQGMSIDDIILLKPSLKIGGPVEDTTYVARGWQGALFCAYKAFQRHADQDFMVIQPRMDQHVPFQVGVIETENGPMAFAPTETRVVDINNDILQYDQELANHQLQLQGQGDAVFVLGDEIGQRVFVERKPPRYPTERQLTPAAINLHMSQQIRRAAERLFKDLELKGFAMIHGRFLINAEYVSQDEYEFYHRFGEGPRYYYDSSVSEGQFMKRWWRDHQLTKRLMNEYKFEHGKHEIEWTGKELSVREMVEESMPAFAEDFNKPIESLSDELYNKLEPIEFEEDAARRTRLAHGNRQPFEFQTEFYKSRNIKINHSLEEGDQDEISEDWLWRNENEENRQYYELGAQEIDSTLQLSEEKEQQDQAAALQTAIEIVEKETPNDICNSKWGLVLINDVEAQVDLSPSSVFFQQASQLGFDYRRILRHILSYQLVQSGLDPLVPMPPQFNVESALFETADKPSFYKYLAENDLFEVPYQWGEEEKLFEFQERFEALTEKAKNAPDGLAEPWQESTAQGQYWGNYRAPKGGFIGDDNVDVIVPHPEIVNYDPPYRQKVRILMGGDGDERNLSLSSGINVWRQLQEYYDMEVEACILVPLLTGEREIQRRRDLLNMRENLMKAGLEEEDIDPEYQCQNIKRPFKLSTTEPDLEWTGVWILPHHLALLSSVEEIMEAVEREHRIFSTIEHSLEYYEKEYIKIREDVQKDFAEWEVQGTGGLWFGEKEKLSPKPRYVDLKRFIHEALFEKAVIFNCIRGEQGEDGQLSQLIESLGGVVTGPSHISCGQCCTYQGLSEQLNDLWNYGVRTPKRLFVGAIEVIGNMEEDSIIAEEFIERMKKQLDEPDAAGIIIRPDIPAGRVGSIYVFHPEDLQLYAFSIRYNVDVIPGKLLYNSPDVELPSILPNTYIVEPAMPICVPSIRPQPYDIPTMRVTGASGWVQLKAAVLGELGEMECLPPALAVIQEKQHVQENQYQETIDIIPPPPQLVPPEILDTMTERIELVANQLQLQGLVQMDVLASVDDGTIILQDLHLVPDLSPTSFIHRASIAQGRCSRELFRTMVSLALVQRVHEIVQKDDKAQIVSGDKDEFGFGGEIGIEDEDEIEVEGEGSDEDVDEVELERMEEEKRLKEMEEGSDDEVEGDEEVGGSEDEEEDVVEDEDEDEDEHEEEEAGQKDTSRGKIDYKQMFDDEDDEVL